jgi:hypothetical protein
MRHGIRVPEPDLAKARRDTQDRWRGSTRGQRDEEDWSKRRALTRKGEQSKYPDERKLPD